jgi:hypothetical protein
MFCALGHVFGGTEGVWSRFHVLLSRTHFRRYRGRRFPFSCFARPDSFSAIARASGPVFMFCASGLIFYGIEGVESLFRILLFRTLFWRCRVCRVPFLCFAHPNTFSAVSTASNPVFMFFRSRTCFWQCGGRRVLFSCFALSDTFSAEPRALGPVFMFRPPQLVFSGIEGVDSHFHLFSFPDSFSAVRRVRDPVFMFCAPGLIFGCTEGVVATTPILRAQISLRQ